MAIRHFIAACQAPRKPVLTGGLHHAAVLSIANDIILLEAWSTFYPRYLAHFIM